MITLKTCFYNAYLGLPVCLDKYKNPSSKAVTTNFSKVCFRKGKVKKVKDVGYDIPDVVRVRGNTISSTVAFFSYKGAAKW